MEIKVADRMKLEYASRGSSPRRSPRHASWVRDAATIMLIVVVIVVGASVVGFLLLHLCLGDPFPKF